MVKAIVFDVGGVLEIGDYKKPVRGHQLIGVHEYISKKLNISIDTWFDAIDSTYAKAIEGTVSKEKTISTISKNLEVSKNKLRKLIIEAYKKNFNTNQELYNIAKKLKKQNYQISILSDQWYFSKEALISEKRTKMFNPVMVSCDLGIRKPNPKIYKLLLKRLKLKPDAVLFIDNREWNLKPAKELGIKTILFKDNKQLIKSLEKLGIFV